MFRKVGSLLSAVCAGMFFSCATPEAPKGGPEDKLPPRVAGVYPAPNTTNHPNELYVKLEFDEWINGSIPRSAVSISPPIEKKLHFDVSGKTLELTSRAELDTGTTYTITFAGGIKDLRGNALAKPFQVVFSTGAVIDSLTVPGRVLVNSAMAKKKEYPSIGLFLLGEERRGRRYLEKFKDTTTHLLDTIPLLLKEPPLYTTRADSAGNFLLTGLKPGRYRVVAFADGNGNQKIELSTEQVGIWTHDLVLTEDSKDTIWVAIVDMDSTLLELESVTQPYANILEANFTRPIYFDSAFTDTSNCYLLSPDNKELYPRLVYPSPRSFEKAQFYFDPAPIKETPYKFICRAGKDSLFRALDTLRNEAQWEWKEMASDTIPSSVFAAKLLSRSKNPFPSDTLLVLFDKPKLDSLEQTFYFVIGKDTNQVPVKQLDPVRFVVEKEADWPTDATINFLMGYKDTTLAAADSNGIRDTVITQKYRNLLKFETVKKLKMASLMGAIPGAREGAMVRLLSLDNGTYYVKECNESGGFIMTGLVEGNYFVDYFYPEKGKLVPDGGAVDPFRFGAAWRTVNDTLKLKNGQNELGRLLTDLPPLP